MTQIPTKTELLVIGGGPGGYVAAIRASQCGLNVTLVEKDAFGGTCLNYGCIPSKALITAADRAYQANHSQQMGLLGELTVQFETLTKWKEGIVAQLTDGVENLCEANDVRLVNGVASFEDDHTARTRTRNQEQLIQFEQAIIATGSRPRSLPGFDFTSEPILDSRQALALDHLPNQLVIVGAGYVGMELATSFAKLGCDVTVIEVEDQVLPRYERDIAEVVYQRARECGVEFHFEERAVDWEASSGATITTESEDNQTYSYETDYILVAIGREPVTDTINCDNAGLTPTDSGFFSTDEQMRTDVNHIFAVGDVAGQPLLAHKASREGIVAAEAAAGKPAAADNIAMPAAVFTDPEIATVGMTESEARDAGYSPVVGQTPLQSNGRALTIGEDQGFVRLIADEDTGFVLGGQIVAPEASELIAKVTLAIELGATVDDLRATIYTHPTLSEAIMEASEDIYERAIHTL